MSKKKKTEYQRLKGIFAKAEKRFAEEKKYRWELFKLMMRGENR